MARSNEMVRVEEARGEMAAASKRLCAAVITTMALLLGVGALFFWKAAGTQAGLPGGDGPVPASMALQALMVVLGVAILAVVINMLAGSAGASPFSRRQAKRFVMLAILFASCALVGMLESVSLVGAHGAEAFLLDATGKELGIISIDILLILAAIVSFYLSRLFEYGSFLQWLYDETF